MTSELTQPAISVVPSGKYALIAGLHWQWVAARGRRRLKIEARDQQASYWLALPAGTADEPATWLGALADDAAPMPKGKRPASLAAAVLGSIPADCWGIFLLPGGNYWFMAVTGGHPSPYGDVTGNAAAVLRAAELFRDTSPAPSAGWVVFDPDSMLNMPDARREQLADLIPATVPPRALLNKTDSRTTSRLLLLGGVCVVAAWYGNHMLEARKTAQHEAWVQAELTRAREAAALKPATLAKPWGGQPDFSGMLSACVKQWRQAPLSIAGWVFSQATCESSGQLTLHYALPDGGTVGDFATRLPQLYGPGIKAVFNMPGPSDDASFSESVHFTSALPETLLPGDEQLRRMTSYAQRLRANLRFSEPVLLAQTVGQDQIPLPWKRYSFTFITDIPPDRLFDASRFPGNGLRLSSVKAELHSSRLTYTLEGMLYADK
ncbi:type 4b pilus protein PilO2 [Pantoea agglomerans]|uniref:type 4b pilus protein PilO2 n=1 Tax=Enterobacter agglomerans TaxID=549 RepID=UPI0017847083|nr:type 4b pilus protein PilO2 [Pantoea agglomerans]MBD8145910.1 type 4b pilus protein PilO2 [Pantoea agglomerans]WVL82698.1 type 4b pilus protein PilO2 [Pantoea agglomerans]WVL87915.1 type 4b pilus protein PilO2 [Pantoea agglomerans]